MKKKILSLLAAFFMLFGTSAMAQVESTLEGDVNGDGVVDIADITAVIAIIKQNAEANPTYYWYVGWTKPTSLDHLKTLATGTHNGMSLGGQTSKASGEKLLTNSPEIGPMIPPAQYYVVIPSNYNIYDATLPNDPITNDSFSEVTDVTIANHKVYIRYVREVTVSGLEIY